MQPSAMLHNDTHVLNAIVVQVLYRLIAQQNGQEEIRVPLAIIKSWFDSLLGEIIEAVQDVLTRVSDNGDTVDYMLIVGGFGGSPYLIAQLRVAFGHQVTDVVCPGVPSQAVLKGDFYQTSHRLGLLL